MTGANGFLGWHSRCAAHANGMTARSIQVGKSFDVAVAADALSGTERFIHIAGVNRGSEEDVRNGNIQFAEQMASALLQSDSRPPVVVFANSTQSRNGTVYGAAKGGASDVLRSAADQIGSEFIDVLLPNLFGEHGTPFYNSVVATFCHLLALGEVPRIEQNRELTLLHAQNAAELLLGLLPPTEYTNLEVSESVEGLLGRLSRIAALYASGDIPDIALPFDRDLFNTYRSFTFSGSARIPLTRRADARGSFFEVVRSHGGQGQSSFSTTVRGVSRGDHYHLRKVERFTVLSGEATISLRRLFSTEVREFFVDGRAPHAVDMPTMWSHNILNTGTTDLFTSFWSNEIFDPAHPDTFMETV